WEHSLEALGLIAVAGQATRGMGNRGRPRKRAGSGRGVTDRGGPAHVLRAQGDDELPDLVDEDKSGIMTLIRLMG
ncbi:hypothetical protein Dimus_026905, partial [Dionaea muscipula]